MCHGRGTRTPPTEHGTAEGGALKTEMDVSGQRRVWGDTFNYLFTLRFVKRVIASSALASSASLRVFVSRLVYINKREI